MIATDAGNTAAGTGLPSRWRVECLLRKRRWRCLQSATPCASLPTCPKFTRRRRVGTARHPCHAPPGASSSSRISPRSPTRWSTGRIGRWPHCSLATPSAAWSSSPSPAGSTNSTCGYETAGRPAFPWKRRQDGPGCSRAPGRVVRARLSARRLHGDGTEVTWYPVECCNSRDCRLVAHVPHAKDGLWLTTVDGVTVLVPADEQRRPSRDTRWHICLTTDASQNVVVQCLFEPTPSRG